MEIKEDVDQILRFSRNYYLSSINGNLYLGYHLNESSVFRSPRFVYVNNAVFDGTTQINGQLNINHPITFNVNPNIGGNRLTNVGTPIDNQDAVNKIYLDNLVNRILSNSYKKAVKVATTGPMALSWNGTGFTGGPITSYDNVSLNVGDRILVKNDSEKNGIYAVTLDGLERDWDSNTVDKLIGGTRIYVQQGTNSGKTFVLTTNTFNLNSDPIVFSEVVAPNNNGGGSGTVSLDSDRPGLVFNGSNLRLGGPGLYGSGYLQFASNVKINLGNTDNSLYSDSSGNVFIESNGNVSLSSDVLNIYASGILRKSIRRFFIDEYDSLGNLTKSTFYLVGTTTNDSVRILTLDGETYSSTSQTHVFQSPSYGSIHVKLIGRVASMGDFGKIMVLDGKFSFLAPLGLVSYKFQQNTSDPFIPTWNIINSDTLSSGSWYSQAPQIVSNVNSFQLRINGIASQTIVWKAEVQILLS